jgi:hypothetical protein
MELSVPGGIAFASPPSKGSKFWFARLYAKKSSDTKAVTESEQLQ